MKPQTCDCNFQPSTKRAVLQLLVAVAMAISCSCSTSVGTAREWVWWGRLEECCLVKRLRCADSTVCVYILHHITQEKSSVLDNARKIHNAFYSAPITSIDWRIKRDSLLRTRSWEGWVPQVDSTVPPSPDSKGLYHDSRCLYHGFIIFFHSFSLSKWPFGDNFFHEENRRYLAIPTPFPAGRCA